jgi:hypothetical protein
MRRVIPMLASMLILAAWPTDLAAQQRGPGGMAVPTDSIVDSYKSRLNLTDEQTASIRQLLEIQAEKGHEILGAAREQGRAAMAEARPKMMELQADTSAQIEALLEDEQIPEFRKIQAENRERRQRRRGQRPAEN